MLRTLDPGNYVYSDNIPTISLEFPSLGSPFITLRLKTAPKTLNNRAVSVILRRVL